MIFQFKIWYINSRFEIWIQDLIYKFKIWNLNSRFDIWIQHLIFKFKILCINSRFDISIQDFIFKFKIWYFNSKFEIKIQDLIFRWYIHLKVLSLSKGIFWIEELFEWIVCHFLQYYSANFTLLSLYNSVLPLVGGQGGL